jgi:septum formation protein
MMIILGSQSPRRKEILSFFSLPFTVEHPSFDEDAHPYRGDPVNYAKEISECKALSLAEKHPTTIVITADTVVYKNGKIYLKPVSMTEAYATLEALGGSWHSVYTSVTVQQGKVQKTAVAETRVLFHELTREEIEKYCAGVMTLDKAGGYAIQGKGAIIVKQIEGCYYNVMGLPIGTLRALLKHFQIDLWDHLE